MSMMNDDYDGNDDDDDGNDDNDVFYMNLLNSQPIASSSKEGDIELAGTLLACVTFENSGKDFFGGEFWLFFS